MSIQSDIQTRLPTMSPVARRIGELIVRDPSIVLTQTISELAHACQTSEPSVVRFCRQLGLKGFVELRIALATELGREAAGAQDQQHYGGDLARTDSLATAVAKIAFIESMAVEETLAGVEVRDLERVVAAVGGARRVMIYGSGASGLVAEDLCHKLFRIGHPAHTFRDADEAVEAAALMTGDDLAFALSHSGQTPTTIAFASRARASGAAVVAVTNNPASDLARDATWVLRTVVRETMFRSGAFASRIAQLALVDCVFVGVAQARYDDSVEALERTRRAILDARR
ncbi:MurR/RpiR family transcriptional regulator [Mariniluteicoccus flavus]